jgi:predicted RNase H-like HicB family nuclease
MKVNLLEYVDLALTTVEITEQNGKFAGSIPDLPGVWAEADSKTELLTELSEVAKFWVIYRVSHGIDLPVLSDGQIVLLKDSDL